MKQIEIATLKNRLNEAIKEKYGTVDDFAKSEFGKSLGNNVKTYLYPSGAVSMPVLQKMCVHLGLGELRKETTVVRTVRYYVGERTPRNRKQVKTSQKEE
jgi:hypothetical protein